MDITPEQAGEWLRRHFDDDPDPQIEIVLSVSSDRSGAPYRRLLDILFSPRPDRPES